MSHAIAHRHAGPLEGVAWEEHVPDESLYRSFTHEADKEKLFYHRGGHGAQWGQAKQQLAESGGLIRILRPTVLLQSTLRFLLKLLDVVGISEAACIWKKNKDCKILVTCWLLIMERNACLMRVRILLKEYQPIFGDVLIDYYRLKINGLARLSKMTS